MQITQILNKIKLKLLKRLIDSNLNKKNNKNAESKITNKNNSNKSRHYSSGFPEDLETK
jgi:hypothetical protein